MLCYTVAFSFFPCMHSYGWHVCMHAAWKLLPSDEVRRSSPARCCRLSHPCRWVWSRSPRRTTTEIAWTAPGTAWFGEATPRAPCHDTPAWRAFKRIFARVPCLLIRRYKYVAPTPSTILNLARGNCRPTACVHKYSDGSVQTQHQPMKQTTTLNAHGSNIALGGCPTFYLEAGRLHNCR
jgi:hypothetical protein